VGFWLGVLLLFVPVFYPLLYFRPYSRVARVGWGLWLGLIVFAKVFGFAEPVINLSQIEAQLREQERGEAAPDRSLRGTFVAPADEAAPPPPLTDYLRELGGGVLGRRIAEYHADGAAIRIAFQPVDWYVGDEGTLALESIGMTLSLFYGRDFERVELDFVLGGRPVRVAVTRAAFQDFFRISEAQVRAALADRASQEASVFHAENLPPELQRAFFERFATYR
jgi:hypothetical protein